MDSRFRLVDLAGSERQSKVADQDQPASSTTEAQFKEAIEINKSLFTLRQVITALTENSKKGVPQNR